MTQPPLARFLGEIGLMAAGYGLNGHAQTIMAAVHDMSPDSAAPAIGGALMLMGAGRHEEAATLLERAHDAVAPRDRQLVSAFLGWSLLRADHRAEGERVLRALLDSDVELDPAAAEMARGLMNENSKDDE